MAQRAMAMLDLKPARFTQILQAHDKLAGAKNVFCPAEVLEPRFGALEPIGTLNMFHQVLELPLVLLVYGLRHSH
jgi:hypothetical protein